MPEKFVPFFRPSYVKIKNMPPAMLADGFLAKEIIKCLISRSGVCYIASPSNVRSYHTFKPKDYEEIDLCEML